VAERERSANLYSSGAVLKSIQYVPVAIRSPLSRHSLKDNIIVCADIRTSFVEYSALHVAGFVHTILVLVGCSLSFAGC
jgi:hypothetical protein